MSKQVKQEEAPKAKGMRRHNASNGRGAVMQGVAVSHPRFFETPIPGVLVLGGTNTMIARDKSNRWFSLSKKERALLPIPKTEA